MTESFIDVSIPLITVWGYPLSGLELAGTLTGLACVWLTARERISCWPVGIINIICFFFMFYQVHLYADMFLQVFFLVMSIYGWIKWANPRIPDEANSRNELRITSLAANCLAAVAAASAACGAACGLLMSRLHLYIPALFPRPSAFPYLDSFIAVFSVTATILMARKKLECWYFWISVDTLAVFVYYLRGIKLVSLEYFVFGMLAAMGLLGWRREYAGYDQDTESVMNSACEAET